VSRLKAPAATAAATVALPAAAAVAVAGAADATTDISTLEPGHHLWILPPTRSCRLYS
jgi:hypothetical protein